MKQASGVAIAWTVSLAVFMAVLDSTVINVAITPMAEAFGVTLNSVQWVLTGYLLAQAAIIPVSGYFGLRWGLKRMFMLSLALFTFSSLLCGIAPDESWLIAFRVLQGLGGGALLPLAQAIALAAFPPNERASVSAIIGVSALLAPVFGPTLGGFLTDTFSWHAIFLVNLPVGIIALVLTWRIVPPDPARQATNGSFDFVGLVLSIMGVLVLVYGLTLVSETDPATGGIYGWGAPLVWALVISGLLLLAGFVWYELRISDPVLDLRILRQREFSLGTLVACLVAMVVFGSLFMLPVFLQQIHIPNATATEAGLVLLPQGLGSALAVMLSGRVLYNRIGPRMLIMLGGLLLTIGSWGWVNVAPDSSIASLLPWLVLRGMGFGFSFVPAQTFAMQRITGSALPKASSLLNMLRQIAGSVGTAYVITAFVERTAFNATEAANLVQAQAMAVGDVFWLVTCGSFLVFLVALALPNRRGREALGSTVVAVE
jgi:EmrB/QacA subfamily drug resistance transporter